MPYIRFQFSSKTEYFSWKEFKASYFIWAILCVFQHQVFVPNLKWFHHIHTYIHIYYTCLSTYIYIHIHTQHTDTHKTQTQTYFLSFKSTIHLLIKGPNKQKTNLLFLHFDILSLSTIGLLINIYIFVDIDLSILLISIYLSIYLFIYLFALYL